MKPAIIVWCLLTDHSEEYLQELQKKIVGVMLSIPELRLKSEDDMIVLFPPDMMSYGLGSEILITVSGLRILSDHNFEARTRLAEGLGKIFSSLYPRSYVECRVRKFDPKDGFWSSTM